MLYQDFTTEISALIPVQLSTGTGQGAASATPFSNADYNNHLPRAIEYAELRILTELDLLNTRQTDNTAFFVANNRALTLPSGNGIFIVTEEVSPIVNGVQLAPLIPVSKEYLDAVYPSNVPVGTPSIPLYWAPVDQVSIVVGPAPDQTYGVSIFGTRRPIPMSATNAQTFIGNYLPDLMVAAGMISFMELIQNLGAQSDDPTKTVSWESIYKERFAAYGVEETRKKFRAVGYSSKIPSPISGPPGT